MKWMFNIGVYVLVLGIITLTWFLFFIGAVCLITWYMIYSIQMDSIRRKNDKFFNEILKDENRLN